ncbi:hypothetical protein GALMADRAFT_226192 [Galerina marginata CBS 339.88]|uniref:Secreted protein n=1 Tax=Galerina marginata (strain CBS 339.88) TaxID=685588 RepID=A0A067SXF1_GALM3|nr:hypothetical protein GALMADRAFT_226192 [Galerina marginata CBS 339.88]
MALLVVVTMYSTISTSATCLVSREDPYTLEHLDTVLFSGETDKPGTEDHPRLRMMAGTGSGLGSRISKLRCPQAPMFYVLLSLAVIWNSATSARRRDICSTLLSRSKMINCGLEPPTTSFDWPIPNRHNAQFVLSMNISMSANCTIPFEGAKSVSPGHRLIPIQRPRSAHSRHPPNLIRF